MFMGEFSHTIDAKGRLIIPARFREELGDKFVVSKGFDGCLQANGLEAWEGIQEKLKELSQFNKSAREVKRFFNGGAVIVEVDKQGRVLIPAELRDHAGLKKNVSLVGTGSCVEIWDSDSWSKAAPDNIDDIAESLSELGFTL
ncbi:MAG: division/cell wall cluster transcriptional repressor MraZ [Lachnospiraceae bacterium]|nr:division/cell wall cluster transcriptional repressor MraZ [Lachnospiraceae bacterium]